MKFKPTLEIAENSVKQCIIEYNQKFKDELNIEDLEQLKAKYEKAYKSFNEDYLENFKMYTIIEIVLVIVEALCLDSVKQLSLSEEEIKVAAQELYERWV